MCFSTILVILRHFLKYPGNEQFQTKLQIRVKVMRHGTLNMDLFCHRSRAMGHAICLKPSIKASLQICEALLLTTTAGWDGNIVQILDTW